MHGPDIIAVAHGTGRTVLEVARGFFLLGEKLQIDWLEQRLEELPADTRWQRWAQQSMEDDLFNLRRQVVERVLEHAGGHPIDEWRSELDGPLSPSRSAWERRHCDRSCLLSGLDGPTPARRTPRAFPR